METLPLRGALAFCLLLVLALPCQGKDAQLEFDQVSFGAGPDVDMVCIRGGCRQDLAPSTKEGLRRIATFKRSLDRTFVGRTEITPPKYDYFDGQLFRIRFGLICRETNAEVCQADVIDTMDEGLGMVPDRVRSMVNNNGVAFQTHVGDRVVISRGIMSSGWEALLVEIYDPRRMESIRHALNPRYHSAAAVQ